MQRAIILQTIFLISSALAAQPENDNCENAIDITPFAFIEFDSYDYIISTEFTGSTVDALNYGSNYCFGYAETTTSSYPDVWLKTTLQANANLVQAYSFYGADTFQLSTYFGTCNSLFQSQCYTVAPHDTLLQYGFSLEYIPHDTAHAMYFQIKAPESLTNGIDILIHAEIAYSFTFYFAYSSPAITYNTTSTNQANRSTPDIHLFPVPVKDAFTIQSTAEINFLEVFNMTGKKLITEKIISRNTTIDASQLSPGMYFVRVETDHGWAIRNFIVAN